MCKRFSFTSSKEVIENRFELELSNQLKTSYNIAPTQFAYVVTNEKTNRLQYMSWGLIPYWSKDGINKGKLINARKEGIAASTSFRIPIRRRRCLVLADSYYDWKKEGGSEVPYRIVQEDCNLMIMAGVWDTWEGDGQKFKSFSIITIAAPEGINEVSDRCPLVLETQEQQERWISEIDLDEVLKIMSTRPQHLKHYPISKKVNSIKYNSIELHEEAAS